MKKIITSLVVMLVLNIAAQAQVQDIRIINNTNCAVSYLVHAGATVNCSPILPSPFLGLAAGASVHYTDPSQVPGASFAATDYFKLVEVFGNINCIQSLAGVYECTGFSNYSSVGTIHDAACNVCTTVTVTWTSTGPNSATVQIDP